MPTKIWTQDTLRKLVKDSLSDYKFIIVSNREPFIHEYTGKKRRCTKALGGLTLALDPVMQACHGTWVAHGSGDADKEVVDDKDRLKVPPDDPQYTLKRIWLTKEEEDGYYYGYANQGLWPLAHIVYHQPLFLPAHWKAYKAVNQKFAEAVKVEIGKDKALIWLHDYHLTLCAKYLKESNPKLRIGFFWHIPWPNPEVFRICPQKKEILEGLLANDLLGFHITYHCHHFLSAVEEELEAKVDWAESAVTYKGHKTLVKEFPISVDAQYIAKQAASAEVTKTMKKLSADIVPSYEIMALSIDRVDYTKGIQEKIQAVDDFLKKHPQYQGRFIFLQIGALSRMHIPAYKQLIDNIQDLAEKVNWKYRTGAWQPIVLLNRRLDYNSHLAYYRHADLCLVGSLHDGMNLVAKEYVMGNVDNKGMLVLSQFTGAARELKDAVLVNPYDPKGWVEAIREAVEMPKREKTKRLKKLRETILDNNIYTWAGKFINELLNLS